MVFAQDVIYEPNGKRKSKTCDTKKIKRIEFGYYVKEIHQTTKKENKNKGTKKNFKHIRM